ncbi:hypothetical protein CLIB1423_15S00716 [[Candida] railenensis]|uniref:Uncharacterized protein n=1 Tax=[Candida] railenensis TaxID=45579 RepID=A0A9P0VYV2_9ASCO|nr:hypothetical protein CLIB1423_15S00716 [[Candida] railenensis]
MCWHIGVSRRFLWVSQSNFQTFSQASTPKPSIFPLSARWHWVQMFGSHSKNYHNVWLSAFYMKYEFRPIIASKTHADSRLGPARNTWLQNYNGRLQPVTGASGALCYITMAPYSGQFSSVCHVEHNTGSRFPSQYRRPTLHFPQFSLPGISLLKTI